MDSVFSLQTRSQFLQKPRGTKILPQWAIEPVLIGLSRINLDDCSEEDRLKKVLFLTALATGNRVSELSAIKRDSLIFTPGDSSVIMAVRPGFLYKNERMDRAPPNISFPALPGHSSNGLCPVTALKKYLQDTTPRNPHASLFLNPSTGANLQRPVLSLWLCRTIEEFCPGSLPKVHDIRKQAASLAWTRGILPSQIVASAFWSSTNVFIDRYLNPKVSSSIPCVAMRHV